MTATTRPWVVSHPDETLILNHNRECVASTFQDESDYHENYDMRADDAKLIVRAVNSHESAFYAMREAYIALAFAFKRLESSARSRDGELCRTFGEVRGKIEKVFKDAGEKL